MLITLAEKYGWDFIKFDITNAFLHGELEENVYIKMPLGHQLVAQLNVVCKLKNPLYGLKPLQWAWFGRFTHQMCS